MTMDLIWVYEQWVSQWGMFVSEPKVQDARHIVTCKAQYNININPSTYCSFLSLSSITQTSEAAISFDYEGHFSSRLLFNLSVFILELFCFVFVMATVMIKM